MGAPQALIRDLYGKVDDISPERRALALRHLTDLFLVGAEQYSTADIALIDDIFVRLVELIDDSARALLAIRLGPVAKAPPKLLHRLACDNLIDVASSVLTQSEALNDATLIECAVTKTQDHMLAISQRKTLSEVVTDVLVKRGDRDVLLSTARNAGARFSKGSFGILVTRAEGDDTLTTCVGGRPDLPPALFDKLLAAASDAVRAKLEAEHPRAAGDIGRVVGEVTAQIRDEAATLTPQQAAARVRVHSLNRAGKLGRAKLEEFAKAGRTDELVAALALMAHVPDNIVADIVNDSNTEPLLVLVRSIGLPWETSRIVVALTASGGPVGAEWLEECRVAFEQLQQPVAREILASYCARRPGKTLH